MKSMFRTVALLLAAAVPALAGPIDPPAGPVAGSMKTLAQVEPRIPLSQSTTPGGTISVFTISQPGSYYLTGNVSVPPGKNGILLTASGVTIDLSGYVIVGMAAGSEAGITRDSGTYTNITIRNGSIKNMGREGIYLTSFGAAPPHYSRIEDVEVYGCGGIGIYINDGIVRNSRAVNCASLGIYSRGFFDSVIEGCHAAQNVGAGIRITQGVLRNCSASDNAGEGLMSSYGTITGCTATNNEVGIYGEFALVTECQAHSNDDAGITTRGGTIKNNSVTAHSVVLASQGISCIGSGARVEGNNISFYAAGVKATAANNLIIGNSFRACTVAMDTAAGNRVGVIVTGTYSPAIVGNSGGGLGTADPMANIVY